ncbi:MAG: hypothetical protein MJ211_07885 [Bacteroidales bacterium]|nr:hypothetical protein [Bacteroidales bacterium]
MAFCKIVFCFFCFLFSQNIYAQIHFAIKADFIEEVTDGKDFNVISKGFVVYNKNENNLFTSILYPYSHKSLLSLNMIKVIENDKDTSFYVNSESLLSSIFYKALHGTIFNFGLEDLNYYIDDVQKINDAVYSTYRISKSILDTLKITDNIITKIIISQKDIYPDSVVMFNDNNNVLLKTFLYNYQLFSGIEFPTQIITVSYLNKDEELYTKTIYKNIVFDDDILDHF